MGDLSDRVQRVFAFAIVVTAVTWALAVYADPSMHVFYVEAAAAITLVVVVMTLWLVRSEHKLVQVTDALHASERRSAQQSAVLKVALDAVEQGVLLVAPDQRVTLINGRAQGLLGLPASLVNDDLTIAQLLQWLWDAGEFGGDESFVDTALRPILRNGGLVEVPAVYTRLRPNGTLLEVRTVLLPGGGAVRTFTDITARARGDERTAAATEALEAEQMAKSAFLANKVAEIHAPLKSLAEAASRLESELAPARRESLETIRQCHDAVLGRVNDVRDFCNLDAGCMTFEARELDVFEVCESALKRVEAQAAAKSLTLVFAPRGRPPGKVLGDPAGLHRVVLELLGHAVEAAAGGAVILRLLSVGRGDAERRLRFEIEAGGAIADHAIGWGQPWKSQHEGEAGLGLAIGRKLIAAMGGKTGVDNVVAEGNVLWFELPFTAAGAKASPVLAQVPRGLTATLIAAESKTRAAMAALLAELGLKVVTPDVGGNFPAADVAFVHVDDPLAADLVRGKRPPGAGDLPFVGFGAQAGAHDSLPGIVGAVTPSAIVQALTGPASCAALASPSKAAEAENALRPLSILLVEHNAVNQRIDATILRGMGHEVDIAANGRAALAKAQIRIYDAIVMDMQMPGMDGFETAHAIRELRGPPGETPIVAIIADAAGGDACLAAGTDDVVSRPVTAAKLRDALAPWASRPAEKEIEEEQVGAAESADSDTAAPTLDPELIDRRQMQAIRDAVGAAGLRERLIRFWADAADGLDGMEQVLAAGDDREACAILRRLEQDSLDLGLIGCAAGCARVCEAIAAGEPPDFAALLSVLSNTLRITQPSADEAPELAA